MRAWPMLRRSEESAMSRAMMRRSDGGNGGPGGSSTLIKGILLGLGGLTALGIALMMMKYVIVIGILGGAAFLGYRVLTTNKALASGEAPARKRLVAGESDFDRKMRELEAIERRLDREISGR
ncbi:MAG: hypothetical protein H6710_03975 [Myxococcales bacterium]|nr:hypothetical protein [Myxococcales bacterium]